MFGLNVFLRDRLVARSTFVTREVRIGRSADNDVQLDNQGVSRYHAAVAQVSGVHVLEEFGGRTGTWVNGERVAGRRGLQDGDRIAIGKFLLVFRSDTTAPHRPSVRDESAYANAGATAELEPSPESRERSCPFVAHIEMLAADGVAPRVHPLVRDLTLVGSATGSDITVDARSAPPRAFALVRGWTGFSVLALAPGLKLNRSPLEGRAVLASRDELVLGLSRWRFLVAPRRGAP